MNLTVIPTAAARDRMPEGDAMLLASRYAEMARRSPRWRSGAVFQLNACFRARMVAVRVEPTTDEAATVRVGLPSELLRGLPAADEACNEL